MAKRNNWTREEFILAFNLYLKLQFGQMYSANPQIIELAKLVGRTPSAIAMRLVNFASVDPFHQKRGVKGLSGGATQCKLIFDEFNNNLENLMFESEQILAKFQDIGIEEKFDNEISDIKNFVGESRERLVKIRVNQSLFRKIILSAYSNRCAISKINIPQLLVASHIKRWSDDKENRLNPSNGICLNALYDKAFDTGLIGITTEYKIILSDKLIKHSDTDYFQNHFKPIENLQIRLPERFLPEEAFIKFHLENYFNK